MTTAHDSTGLALLAGIAAEPDEDAPRLVYADYLDEHGDHDRAEFIRVQCEAERCRRGDPQCTSGSASWCPVCGDCTCASPEDSKSDAGCPLHCPLTSAHDLIGHASYLDAKAGVILAANETQWRAGPRCEGCDGKGEYVTPTNKNPLFRTMTVRCLCCDGTGDAGGLLRRFAYPKSPNEHAEFNRPEPVRVAFRRGFPHRVTCPRLADALQPVEVSDFTDRGEVIEHDYEATPWLAAVLAAHPTVREVVPLDREPMRLPNPAVVGHPFIWHPMPDHNAGHTLPPAFADLLSGERRGDLPDAVLRYYPTPEAAVAALGVAVAEVARGG
jgi:uncharacterized protein (TIGR02996 family)